MGAEPRVTRKEITLSTNDKRIQRAKKKAHENDQYSGCSQSVLLSLQEEFGIGNNEVFKAATVLSGGSRATERPAVPLSALSWR